MTSLFKVSLKNKTPDLSGGFCVVFYAVFANQCSNWEL